MRGFVIFLGLLLMLGGGAVAGAQYAPIELSTIQVFDQVPGSREFLMTQNALYAGAGAAGFGFLLIIIAHDTVEQGFGFFPLFVDDPVLRHTVEPGAGAFDRLGIHYRAELEPDVLQDILGIGVILHLLADKA